MSDLFKYMTILVITIVLLPTTNIFAQTFVNYTYDVSGNRTQRYLTIVELKSSDSISSADIPVKNSELVLPTKVYPNPTFGLIYIEINSELSNDASIDIYNNDGRFANTFQLNSAFGSIDISNFSKGVYFLVVTNNKEKSLYKIIKQ